MPGPFMRVQEWVWPDGHRINVDSSYVCSTFKLVHLKFFLL